MFHIEMVFKISFKLIEKKKKLFQSFFICYLLFLLKYFVKNIIDIIEDFGVGGNIFLTSYFRVSHAVCVTTFFTHALSTGENFKDLCLYSIYYSVPFFCHQTFSYEFMTWFFSLFLIKEKLLFHLFVFS